MGYRVVDTRYGEGSCTDLLSNGSRARHGHPDRLVCASRPVPTAVSAGKAVALAAGWCGMVILVAGATQLGPRFAVVVAGLAVLATIGLVFGRSILAACLLGMAVLVPVTIDSFGAGGPVGWLLVLVAVFAVWSHRTAVPRPSPPTMLLLWIAWVAVVLVGLLRFSENAGALSQVATYALLAPAAFFLGALLVARPGALLRLLWTVSLTATVASVVGIWEFLTSNRLLEITEGLVFRTSERGDLDRVQSVFPHPIVLGAVVGIAIPVSLHLLWRRGGRRFGSELVLGACLVAQVAALVVSGSRGPMLAAVAGTAWWAWKRFRLRASSAFLAGAIVVLLGIIFQVGSAFDVVIPGSGSAEASFSAAYRQELLSQLPSVAVAHPLGLGPGRNLANPIYGSVLGTQVDLSRTVDNTFGYALIQFGIPGALVLLGIVAVVARRFHRRRSPAVPEEGYDLLALGAAGVVALVNCIAVAAISFDQLATLVWVIAGAIWCSSLGGQPSDFESNPLFHRSRGGEQPMTSA
jgi:hypothetical protein